MIYFGLFYYLLNPSTNRNELANTIDTIPRNIIFKYILLINSTDEVVCFVLEIITIKSIVNRYYRLLQDLK